MGEEIFEGFGDHRRLGRRNRETLAVHLEGVLEARGETQAQLTA